MLDLLLKAAVKGSNTLITLTSFHSRMNSQLTYSGIGADDRCNS